MTINKNQNVNTTITFALDLEECCVCNPTISFLIAGKRGIPSSIFLACFPSLFIIGTIFFHVF